MALARALATADGKPLHAWLPGFGQAPRLPIPCFSVLNGGAHAPNPLDFQEFMVCPLGAPSIAEAIRSGAEVYAALKKRLAAGGHATGLGDEGGFAPSLAEPEEVLEMIVAAIADAGYTPGTSGVAIALDPAASPPESTASFKKATTGEVNWTRVAVAGAAGLIGGGLGAAAAGKVAGSCLTKAVTAGAVDGAVREGMMYFTEPGPHNVGGFFGSVAMGGAGGGHALGKVTGWVKNACFTADTEVLMADG